MNTFIFLGGRKADAGISPAFPFVNAPFITTNMTPVKHKATLFYRTTLPIDF
jgi:hypothetical protein